MINSIWDTLNNMDSDSGSILEEEHSLGDSKKFNKNSKRIKSEEDTDLYPNTDASVWLRSCEKEIIEPIAGTVSGTIPAWLNGQLLRNGPGSLKVGDQTFNHLFDSSALVHRFGISNGQVTYQCRFIRTNSYVKNHIAQRIVSNEFGTKSVPDPCHSIFHRIATFFKPGEATSDNAMISIYPFNDEYFAFTESPVIFKIDPHTLSTEKRLNLAGKLGIVNHTSHPHVMEDGTVYNLGQSVTKTGPNYVIICFPHGEHIFDNAHVVASVPSRLKFSPSYMHTFGITTNYFLIVEQPLFLSVPTMVKSHFANKPLISSLKWCPEKQTFIYVVSRKTGKLVYTFRTEAFFYLHIINSYEEDNHIVLDICCYKDPGMINCMYVEAMKNMQHDPDYAKLFRGRPLRFVLPLIQTRPTLKKSQSIDVIKHSILQSSSFHCLSFDKSDEKNNNENDQANTVELIKMPDDRPVSEDEKIETILASNLITLSGTKCQAFCFNDGTIFCKPELICNIGCETPRYNYEKCLGVKYRYFYAIGCDVDAENPGLVVKVDLHTKKVLTWGEENCYPSEPIFVPTPDSKHEDDGIILLSMVWGKNETNRVGLLILCAKTMKEIGRSEFTTPGPVPKCLHGWYAAEKS